MYRGKKVLVIGGTGSWGEELVAQLLQEAPGEIIVYSRNENAQVNMQRRLENNQVTFRIGNILDRDRLQETFAGVDVVFHLAALKHVPICEMQPLEALKINVLGTQNIINAALEAGVEKVINVSTDKAADPSNFYGLTKAIAEKLVIYANLNRHRTRFINVRGGNVLGTSGSVVGLFQEQIRTKSRVEITHPEMSRFFMTKEQAIKLLLLAASEGKGGETFIMKMPCCRILDLAEVLIEASGRTNVSVKEIGIRPGEKIHEILHSDFERRYMHDYDEHYYVLLPQIPITGLQEAYSRSPRAAGMTDDSDIKFLTKDEIRNLLARGGFI